MAANDDILLQSDNNGVRTLRMNNPRRLNGWTEPMLKALSGALRAAAEDDGVRVVVLTGTDKYYCAGVNLAGTLRLSHPKKLRSMIIERNQALFDCFIDFPKPMLIAANGPAIGAAVTSATLVDAIIASEKATFSTPFAKLGVEREGCSSVHFARIMDEVAAERMLGAEGWVPTAAEALKVGLVNWVVPHDDLAAEAQRIAEQWATEGKARSYRGGSTKEELNKINAEESVRLADSFLAAPFLKGQFKFLRSKGKTGPAAMFLGLWLSRPVWSRLL